MVPVKLSLHNFMSYADGVEPLDFRHIHTASLVGMNGHGKSALLDAITWALWGKARSDTDSLVRMGAGDMRVELEFELEGALYRVTRSRSLAGSRPHSMLGFFVRSSGDGSWQALNGESIRETERKIVKALRMDYDTFINSAFILQGRADEFTVKSPAERKRVLAEILGLGIYDELEALARDRAKEERGRVRAIDEGLDATATQVAHKEEYQREVRRLQDELEAVNQEVELLEHEKSELSDLRALILSKESRLKELDRGLGALSEESVRYGHQIEGQERRVAEIEKLLAERAVVLESYQEYSKAKDRDDELSRTQSHHNSLKQTKSDLERMIDRKRHELEIERNNVASQLQRLYDEKKECERITEEQDKILEGYDELMRTKTMLASLDETSSRLRQVEAQRNALEGAVKDEKHRLQIRVNSLRERYDEMRRRITVAERLESDRAGMIARLKSLSEMEKERERVREEGLEGKSKLESLEAASVRLKEETSRKEKSTSLIVDATHCPLCGGELHEAERENVRRNYVDELLALQAELAGNIQQTKECKARISDLRERYIELGKKLQDKVEMEKKLAEISVAAEQAHEARSEMESAGRELSEMESMLMEGRFSADEKASLEQLFQEIEKLGYDENYHLKIRSKADELQTFQLKKSELDSAVARIVSIADRLPAPQERLRDIEEALKTRSYVQEEDDKLKEVEDSLLRLNYRQDVHQRVKEELSHLSWVQEKKVLLDQAQRSIQVERELLDRMRSDREEVEKRSDQLKCERDALEADLKDGAGTLDRLGKLDGLLKERHEASLALREGLGISKEKLEGCLRLERQYQAKLKEREEANYKGAIYDELSAAFGKKGIQAIIIENVIPILEREANAILSRMTDNRMHITFETQREKKGSTGVVETLDIRISDELGTRSYELYSGGEAFRVNFAIRIALSKLLAERAGARLRALIIDEGFGTQDGEGRERLVEALRAIEKDFDKIIVVTHIPELKDAFPARIEVQKSPEGGSRFEVFYNN